MRALVCGGRDFDDKQWLYEVLDTLPITEIIQGDANGADLLAKQWAIDRDIDHQDFPARWQTEGRKAGPLRNRRMLDTATPDIVIAFPGGTGTNDMVKYAISKGVPVKRMVKGSEWIL